MFQIPVKEIIVNSDDQVKLLNGADSTAYADGDVASASDTFILEGFLNDKISQNDMQALSFSGSSTELIKITPTAAAAHDVDYQITGVGTVAVGSVFRLMFESLDGTPTEYQNQPIQKIYQISGTIATAANIASRVKETIDADPDSKVTVAVSTDTLTFTAKETGVRVRFFFEDAGVGAASDNTAPALSVGHYADLKNINWSKNFDVDRNAEYFPRKGNTYNIYYFEVNSTGFLASSGGSVPSEVKASARTGFRIYAAVGTQLDTDLNLLKGDIDAIV